MIDRARRAATEWAARPTPVFIRAFLFGGEPNPFFENPNEPGDVTALQAPDQLLIIEEGRRQLEEQGRRLENIQTRSQTLLTVSLVVLAFSASVFTTIKPIDSWPQGVAFAGWFGGAILILCGTLLAAAVICVRATFEAVDTTLVSAFKPPLHAALAADYAQAVRRGEVTVADRLTTFRIATRHVVWGAILTFVAYLTGTAG